MKRGQNTKSWKIAKTIYMTKKLIHCPKCGENSFIELNIKDETRNIRKKDFDKILRAVASVPPPKSWKRDN